MLDEFDLEDREEILCSADGWNAYNNYPAEPNPRGTVTGKIVAPNTKHHGLEFVMHGISKTEGVTWLDEKLFIAEVVSVQKVWRGEGSTDLVKLTVINPSKRNPKGGETTKPDLKKLEDIVEMFPGPDGVLLTYKEWQHEVQGGCVYCSDPIDPRDAKHIVWVGWAGADDNPVCLACQNNPDTRSEMMNWGIELPLREVKGNA
jgi:hypothetical protein